MSHDSNLAAAAGHGERKMVIPPSCNNKEKRYDLHFLILPSKIFNFRLVVLYGYWDSDGLPHHSSDVFLHGASISDRVGGVGALYLSNSYGFVKSSYFFNQCPQVAISAASLQMWLTWCKNKRFFHYIF